MKRLHWTAAGAALVAVGVLVAVGGLAVWLHQHKSWAQPVESAAAFAAALFTAVAAVSAATAASTAGQAAQSAARALALHQRPRQFGEFHRLNSGEEGPRKMGLTLSLNGVPGTFSVQWRSCDGVKHPRRELPSGQTTLHLEGAEDLGAEQARWRLRSIQITLIDANQARWRWQPPADADGYVQISEHTIPVDALELVQVT